MKTFYISTPIYYPSGKPHIGHAYSTILADVINRYKKLIGYQTFFVTGTDEHGKKIELKAKENNLLPQQYVDQMVTKFIDLWKILGIEYDHFSRTTDPNHIQVVQKIFDMYQAKGYIYLDNWEGLYCNSCEENFTSKDATKQDEHYYCPQGHKLVSSKEESYFFKMSAFNEWITTYFQTHHDFIMPHTRMNELVNNFLNAKITDLSISRSSFDWGIKINNSNHVIYVWMDALFNYLTALGYLTNNDQNYQKFWNNPQAERVHILSKEITRFHCIYWPIFLHGLDLNQPTKIISHGWILSNEGKKMSKSFGKVIDPFEMVEKYSRDGLRYYLIKDMSLVNDNIFSEEALIGTFNGDLANNFGNLISRSIGMLKKYNEGIIPSFNEEKMDHNQQHILAIIKQHKQTYIDLINEFNFNKLLNNIQDLINECNKLIELSKPWELFKNQQTDILNNILVILFKVIEIATYWLSPILLDGIKQAQAQTNIKPNFTNLDLINTNQHVKVNDSLPIYLRIKGEEK